MLHATLSLLTGAAPRPGSRSRGQEQRESDPEASSARRGGARCGPTGPMQAGRSSAPRTTPHLRSSGSSALAPRDCPATRHSQRFALTVRSSECAATWPRGADVRRCAAVLVAAVFPRTDDPQHEQRPSSAPCQLWLAEQRASRGHKEARTHQDRPTWPTRPSMHLTDTRWARPARGPPHLLRLLRPKQPVPAAASPPRASSRSRQPAAALPCRGQRSRRTVAPLHGPRPSLLPRRLSALL